MQPIPDLPFPDEEDKTFQRVFTPPPAPLAWSVAIVMFVALLVGAALLG